MSDVAIPTTSSTRTVVVLGASYGGARAARLLSQSLPSGWRVVVIDRNSHMNRGSSRVSTPKPTTHLFIGPVELISFFHQMSTSFPASPSSPHMLPKVSSHIRTSSIPKLLPPPRPPRKDAKIPAPPAFAVKHRLPHPLPDPRPTLPLYP